MLLTDSLSIFFIFLIAFFSLIGGATVALIIMRRNKQLEQIQRMNSDKAKKAEEAKKNLPREQLRNFMNFDKIEDDMIIQEKGKRFVMVIKCSGINYDLMSEPEMLSVEEGFGNFLNTLRFPIQLYVQSRSLNLEEGINVYKKRLNYLKGEYDKYQNSVIQAKLHTNLTRKQQEQMDMEISKKRILLEYGADIVSYIEKMSKNKNILERKYYIVVSYNTSELGLTTNFSKEEARDLAYSELYTRCRSVAGALAPCGVECSLLKSEELAELLYVAYNKDEADAFDLQKALDAGFCRLYSTSQDILEKKQMALDKAVAERAQAEAEMALQNAIIKSKEQNEGLTYEQKLNDATKTQAIQMIIENQDQFEEDVVDIALADLNSQMYNPIISPEELEETQAVDENNAKQTDVKANTATSSIDKILEDTKEEGENNVI